jgi:hypothetical protein
MHIAHTSSKDIECDDAVGSTIACEPLYVIGRQTIKKPCFSNCSKFVHNWLNLGSQRAKFHTASSDTAKQCRYCQHEENFVHLMTCTDPCAKKCRFEATTPLRKCHCIYILLVLLCYRLHAQLHIRFEHSIAEIRLDRLIGVLHVLLSQLL